MKKIKDIFKEFINFFFEKISLRLISKNFYDISVRNKELVRTLEVIPNIKTLEDINKYLENIENSESQKNRVPMDLFVLQYLGFKKMVFFFRIWSWKWQIFKQHLLDGKKIWLERHFM